MNIFDKIKLALSVRKAINLLKGKNMKTGWRTTEFWVTLAGVVGMLWAGFMSFLPAETVAQIVGFTVGLYTIARTVVKMTDTPKDDEFLQKIIDAFNKKKKK